MEGLSLFKLLQLWRVQPNHALLRLDFSQVMSWTKVISFNTCLVIIAKAKVVIFS